MITVHKQLLCGSPDDVRATLEHLARGEGNREYLAGTWLRELAIGLAACDGLAVSAVRYDDMAGYELEVTLENAPHLASVVIGRSRIGDHCQVTLERWLPIDSEPGIKDAVDVIHAILAASASYDPAKIIGTPADHSHAGAAGSCRASVTSRSWAFRAPRTARPPSLGLAKQRLPSSVGGGASGVTESNYF